MTKWSTEVTVPEFGEPVRRENFFDNIEVEDGGQALIYHVEQDDGQEQGFFVQLRSWGTLDAGAERVHESDAPLLKRLHPKFAEFAGKRIRVTVEVVD